MHRSQLKWIGSSLLLILTVVCLSSTARGQSVISGKITAANGQALSGAVVMATHVDRPIQESTIADTSGNYRLQIDYSGDVKLTAALLGYAEAHKDRLHFSSGSKTTMDFRLEPNSDDRGTIQQLPHSSFLSLLPEGWSKRELVLTEMALTMRKAVLEHLSIADLKKEVRRQVVARNRPGNSFGAPTVFPTESYENPEAIAHWLAKYAERGAKLKNFRLPAPPTPDTANAQITQFFVPEGKQNHDLYVASNGIVWATQKPDGLFRLDPKTGESRTVPFAYGNRGIIPAGGEKVWIVTYPGKIVEFDLETEKPGRVFDLSKELGTFFPHTMRKDQDGNLWVGDYMGQYPGRGAVIEVASGKVQAINYPPLPLPFERSATENYGLTICSGSQVWNALLHASTIVKIDTRTRVAEPHEIPEIDGGPRRLDCAPDGMLWIPLHAAGALLRYDPKAEVFQKITIPTQDAGPYTLKVNPGNGDVWITTRFSNQVYRYIPKTGKFSVYEMPPDGIFWSKDFGFVGDHEVWITQDGYTRRSVTRIRY